MRIRVYALTEDGPWLLGSMSPRLAFRAMAGWLRTVDRNARFQIRLVPAQKNAIGDGCSFEGPA